MPRPDSSVVTLAIAAGLATLIGFTVTFEPWEMLRQKTANSGLKAAVGSPARAASAQRTPWVASAPGRIEPKGGEIRLSAQAAGRVALVAVAVNDQVRSGDLIVKLEDDDLYTKHAGLEAEVAVRKRERDQETVSRIANDRRMAEDAVATAERLAFQLRQDLDAWELARRSGRTTAAEVDRSRDALAAARDKLEQERTNLKKAQTATGVPLATRLESALTAARAELSLAESAIERTRVRAPANGTVLQINARLGETANPAAELSIVVFGNLTSLQARAEVEERDVAKIRVGQRAVVKSDAYPGREFEGQVSVLAQSLAAPRLANRGPRRPNDVDVLEAVVTLDGQPSLLPGMRVDMFFKPDATVQTEPEQKAN